MRAILAMLVLCAGVGAQEAGEQMETGPWSNDSPSRSG